MKILKILSVLGFVAVATACGSGNNSESNSGGPSSGTTCTTVNGVQTCAATNGTVSGAMFTQSGSYFNGIGTVNETRSYPIYTSTNAIYNGTSLTYSRSMTVAAGDLIVVNPSGIQVEVVGTCPHVGGLINTSIDQFETPSVVVTLNGSTLSGTAIAPSAGTLTITLSYSQNPTGCGQPTLNYFIQAGSNSIYDAQCTQNGSAVTCVN